MTAERSILVRSPNWVGDQILAYPFFYTLRRAYPRAKITTVCVPWVKDLQFRAQVDEVVVIEPPRERGFGAKWRAMEAAAARVRQAGNWDLGILLPESFSAAWVLRRAGLKRLRGYPGDGRGWLLAEKQARAAPRGVKEKQHRTESYLHLVGPRVNVPPEMAAKFFTQKARVTDLDVPEAGVLDRFDWRAEWPEFASSQLAPPVNEGGYWVLAPGSMAESRRWPIERFISLAQQIAQKTGWKGAVIGGPAERAAAEAICSAKGTEMENKVGQGSIPALARLLEGAKLCVSNDSGLAHVATLMGCPTQIVWGAGDPKVTRPIGPGRVQLAFQPVSCWPCERNECSREEPGRLECLRAVEASWVYEEAMRAIG